MTDQHEQHVPDLSHIVPALRPLAVPIDSLTPDPANPRLHDERNLRAIRDSLTAFGQDQPLVVQREGMIVRKGNGRLQAARSLGWTHVAAVVLDEATIEAVARGIADNRSTELADWDYETLGRLLRTLKDDGKDLDKLGWTKDEVDPLLQAEWKPPAVEDDGHHDLAPRMAKPIPVTEEQRQVIDEAVARLRAEEGRDDLTDGRCLELICVDYLNGNPWPDDPDGESDALATEEAA
jgi:hypothetical protein